MKTEPQRDSKMSYVLYNQTVKNVQTKYFYEYRTIYSWS